MKETEGGSIKDKDIQQLIGSLLRWGVLLSMIVVTIGGVIYLFRHGHNISDYSTFKLQPDFTREVWPLLQGVLAIKGRAIIQLGIMLLIATPIMRVLFSAIGFFLEKDYLYVAITVLVLAIIMFSMFGGFGS
ncbi:hypothetical protein BEL04_09710 [Mucilaginibacter sp. PPCGB 2223]|uniref:DUF1634 domain-containing protein n=1 Tax=Mucilaginibacter sp. PPCGB 2223 TaxID=1886027 RepID=UPI000826B0EA|nr:DUF1634 domain-containing protein [Mucilaginibacter sp. PPCGB 2223]OCX54503.1 hypothetical protein BEL04_09710 [Mucilaginibacter sp. PPCGB 2223]